MPIQENESASIVIDESIYIKPFGINSDLETEKIVVSEDLWTVKRYNYHQWVAPLNDILREFTVTRFSKYGTFKKGILSSLYSSTPDLVLECKVLNCIINNSSNVDRPNNVELSIAVTLLKSDKENFSYLPIFSKTYTQSMARKDNSLETAVDVLSKLISAIDDAIIVDIYRSMQQ
jgi:ABC-type uncharacterized transport system auxiliary subunit